MPKLPTFSAGGGEYPAFGGRRASSEDFGGGADLVRAGHAVQGAATALMTEFEDQEARKALVSSTAIRAKYNKRLDDAALSDEDTDKIKEEMLNELGSVGADFQTKRGAQDLEMYTAGAEISFDNEAARMKVEKAAADAKVEGSRFLNSAGSNVQRDPTRLKQEEAAAEAFAETFRGKLPAAKLKLLSEGLKQDLNMAAAVAMARVDPEGTKKKLLDGEFNLSPDQRETAIHRADTEARAKKADEAYQRSEKQRQKVEENDTARDAQFALIMNGKASQRTIMDDPRLMPATREHLIMLMEARAKAGAAAERKSDAATKNSLWMGINAPEGDPNKMYNADAIFAAVKAGKLTTVDADYLNGQVAAQRDSSGNKFGQKLSRQLSLVGRVLNDSPGYKNQPDLSLAIQNSLIAQVEQKAEDLRRQGGKGVSPLILLDPESKEYFFKPGLLKQTAASVRQQQADARLEGVPDMRKSPDAWKSLKAGDRVVNPAGQLVTVTQATLDALGASGGKETAKEKPVPEDANIVARSRRGEGGGFVIEAGPRSAAGLKALAGQRFATREEARAAVRKAYE